MVAIIIMTGIAFFALGYVGGNVTGYSKGRRINEEVEKTQNAIIEQQKIKIDVLVKIFKILLP